MTDIVEKDKSWWVGLEEAAFYSKAREEAYRMRNEVLPEPVAAALAATLELEALELMGEETIRTRSLRKRLGR